MKFAHMADVHLGSWSNHPEFREMPMQAFEMAMNMCIDERVDFILIAGDLFDTSIPNIDVLKQCAAFFRKINEKGIRIYVVPGSHDFSPTGKTMLHVFENAGLLKNVAKYKIEDDVVKLEFTQDETGAKITGMLGKMGSLEHSYYEKIDRSIESEEGFKIFMLHSAIAEYMPVQFEKIDALSLSQIPKNFNYYANGHVHIKMTDNLEKGVLAFPGPLFPTSFDELEKYDSSFYIVSVNENGLDVKERNVKLCDVATLKINANGKNALQVEDEIINGINRKDINGRVLLIKIFGELEAGKPSDVDFKKLFSYAIEKGAKVIKKNTSKFSAKDFKDVEIDENIPVEDLEKEIVKKHAREMKLCDMETEKIIFDIMKILKDEKIEGETNATFEERIKSNIKELLNI
jgi:DNA repair exonuclease SbcCD nuclease subunit